MRFRESRWGTQQTFILLIVIVSAVTALLLTNLRDYHSSDFGYYWVAGRMLLEGKDPYQVSDWIPFAKAYGTDADTVISFPYPLTMILLFLPLASIDLSTASVIWIFLISVMVFTSLGILFSRLEKQIQVFIPLLIGILFYRPIITVFFWGQMTSLIFFLITISAYFIHNGKWKTGAFILALLLIKPQIGIPMMALATFWFLLRRKWYAILVEGISALLFLAPSFIRDPYWISSWLSSGKNSLDIVFGYAATLWGFGALICKGQMSCGFPVAIGLVTLTLAAGGILIYLLRNQDVFSVYSVAVCTVLLTTPYLLINDLIALLFPMLTAVRGLQKAGMPYWFVSTQTILLSLLAFGGVGLARKFQSDAPSSMISLFVLVLFVFTYFLGGRWVTRRTSVFP